MIITVPFTSGSILAADLGLSPDTVRTCGCVCRDGSILSWYNALTRPRLAVEKLLYQSRGYWLHR